MNQEKMVFYKGLLEARLRDLLEEAEKAVNGMGQERSEDFPDPTDRASFESDRNFQLRIKDRERKLIIKVKEALDRIENGTFGICDSCGKPISEKRLIARPVTTQCIECKTADEQQEKMERLRGAKATRKYPA